MTNIYTDNVKPATRCRFPRVYADPKGDGAVRYTGNVTVPSSSKMRMLNDMADELIGPADPNGKGAA